MNDVRLLNDAEIMEVSGGLSICPVDEWWNPNALTDDAGQIQSMPASNGPFDRYWTNGNLWCMYDDNNNLLGIYKEDPNGTLDVTFESGSTVQGQTFGLGYDSQSGGGTRCTYQRFNKYTFEAGVEYEITPASLPKLLTENAPRRER